MAVTYEAIATNTLASNASSVTFSSIPSTYTDLFIACNIKSLTNGVEFYMRLNSDTATNYSRTILTGNGSTASSARSTSATSMRLAYETVGTNLNNWSTLFINVMNYSNSITYKTALCRGGDAATELSANVGLWRSTSAINSIQLSGDAAFSRSDLAVGSTFTLYGIKAA